jgi:hypothetical protein
MKQAMVFPVTGNRHALLQTKLPAHAGFKGWVAFWTSLGKETTAPPSLPFILRQTPCAHFQQAM